MRMLTEVVRILKPGGICRIATPNLDAILDIRGSNSTLVKEYLDWSATTFFPEQVARFGSGAKSDVFVINNYMHNWGHQFIHTPNSLQLILTRAGFGKCQHVELHGSQDPELQGLEHHGDVIPPHFNAMETMVFEATK
jgi:hypothetical protein